MPCHTEHDCHDCYSTSELQRIQGRTFKDWGAIADQKIKELNQELEEIKAQLGNTKMEKLAMSEEIRTLKGAIKLMGKEAG
jgi:dynactin complex subunit